MCYILGLEIKGQVVNLEGAYQLGDRQLTCFFCIWEIVKDHERRWEQIKQDCLAIDKKSRETSDPTFVFDYEGYIH